MKIFLFAFLCLQTFSLAEIPTLHFDNKMTWKQVFDSGFRPKWLEGSERNTCVCENQSFLLQFKDREPKFRIGTGRVSFSLLYDDFLSMLWFQGSEAITLAEGRHRADEFRRMFDGYIVQEITMPNLIDPSGLVDAGNDKNDVRARVGEYLIYYGFDNSMGRVRPIIPHFYIAWSFPGMHFKNSKDPRDVVRPPAGYEWYSLDPKVNTPDPGTLGERGGGAPDPAGPAPVDRVVKQRPDGRDDAAGGGNRVILWWFPVLLFFAGVAWVYFQRRSIR